MRICMSCSFCGEFLGSCVCAFGWKNSAGDIIIVRTQIAKLWFEGKIRTKWATSRIDMCEVTSFEIIVMKILESLETCVVSRGQSTRQEVANRSVTNQLHPPRMDEIESAASEGSYRLGSV